MPRKYKSLGTGKVLVKYCLLMMGEGEHDKESGYTKLNKESFKRYLSQEYDVKTSAANLDTLFSFYSVGYTYGYIDATWKQ